MNKFRIFRAGHSRNARHAIVQLGLVDVEQLAVMTDTEVENIINSSGYLIFTNDADDGYVLIPRKYAKELIWLNR